MGLCSPVGRRCVGQTHGVPVQQQVVEDSGQRRGRLVTAVFVSYAHDVVSHLTALNAQTFSDVTL